MKADYTKTLSAISRIQNGTLGIILLFMGHAGIDTFFFAKGRQIVGTERLSDRQKRFSQKWLNQFTKPISDIISLALFKQGYRHTNDHDPSAFHLSGSSVARLLEHAKI